MRINPLVNIAKSPAAKRYVDWALKEHTVVKDGVEKQVTNYSKLQKGFPYFFLWWLALAQSGFLLNSKTMPEERKGPLVLNTLYSCVIGTIGGMVLNKKIAKLTENMVKRADVIYKEHPKKDIFKNGIKNAVPIAVAAFFFEFIGPVVSTPMATQSMEFLKKHGIVKSKRESKKD